MKLPEYAFSRSDRVSTREELFQVLEALGGFEEPEETELAKTGDLLACLEAESPVTPAGILDEISSDEERLLMEIEPYNSLVRTKAERIN